MSSAQASPTTLESALPRWDMLDEKPPVRLAYLLSQYPAISHTFFLNEVLGLRKRGVEIETVSINPPDRPLADLPAREAVEARRTEYIKGTNRWAALRTLLSILLLHPAVVGRGLHTLLQLRGLTLRQRGFWLFYLAEALLVGRWMISRRLTHLHVHFGGPVASVGMLTAAAWKFTWSITIHGPEELENVDAYQLREKIRRVSFAICISDFCRSQLYQLVSPECWDKFYVIRLGVDPVLLAPAAPAAAEPRPVLRLVCTGRLVAAKGHRILLEALVLLRAHAVAFQMTLIGNGVERKSLEAYVALHGLSDCVTFTSALSHAETLAHVRRADVFVLASFAEGIPVAMMEAMALGLATVGTSIAGIPELISSGIDGLLVAPANPVALAGALEQLARRPEFRRQLGRAGRQKILACYNLPLNQEALVHRLTERLAQRVSVVGEGGAQ